MCTFEFMVDEPASSVTPNESPGHALELVSGLLARKYFTGQLFTGTC